LARYKNHTRSIASPRQIRKAEQPADEVMLEVHRVYQNIIVAREGIFLVM
jgi:hypothetical protein